MIMPIRCIGIPLYLLYHLLLISLNGCIILEVEKNKYLKLTNEFTNLCQVG